MSSDAVPNKNPPEETSSGVKTTSLGRLAAWAVLAFILFAVAIVCFGFFDGVGWLRSLTAAPLAPAEGTITIGTEPLTFGHLLTKPVSGYGRGSMGVVETDGRFVLRTDIEGSFVNGAEVGTHKVVVHAQQGGVALGAAAAPSLIASKFSSFETTPLVIEVTRDPTKNKYSLVVEKNAGNEQESPTSNDQKSSAAPSSDNANPALIVLQQRLPGVDLDGDGKYTRDELIRAKSKAVNKFIELDADGNATLEGSELEQLVEFLTSSSDGN